MTTHPTLPADQGTGHAERLVLVMDDNDDLRYLYSKKLMREGFQVHQAATVQEARDLLALYHFHAFICDIRMGAEQGTDLLQEQGAELIAKGTQIIVVSSEAQYREMCQELGVHLYMEKPVSLETLAILIDRLTNR